MSGKRSRAMKMSGTGAFIGEIPGREFGPAPWWTWMGDITRASIDRDLRRFLKMEIYEIIPIPLYGLKQEYMGGEYLDLYRHACARCREWGMRIWIYDEFNWPSGCCAGRVLETARFRQRTIRIDPASGSWKISENRRFQLTAYGALWASGRRGYPDLLNPDAVDAYIRLTHEQYKRSLGEYFGDVVSGFFTDEPQMVGGGEGFPYTPGFFEMFMQRYGYDIRPGLRALAGNEPGGDGLRRDYWSLVSELFRLNFFRKYACWCAGNNLALTGHLLREETLGVSLHHNGDIFGMLSEMQVPGIDLLGCWTSFDEGVNDPNPRAKNMQWDITGKLIESIGYFCGRERTMCEAFGAISGTSTMARYKRAADFLFHNGISMINDNLFPDSMSSFRKFCGCHSFLTPWTAHYNILSRHIRAMSYLNSGSELATRVGLFYPGTDAFARYRKPSSELMGLNDFPADWESTQQTLYELAHGLPRAGWDYYLVFEQSLRGARPAAGGLRMKGFNCRVLVFPDVHYVDSATAAGIKRFVRAGGVMLCAGRVPKELDDSGSAREVAWGASGRVVELSGVREKLALEVSAEIEKHLKRPLRITGAGAGDVLATRRKTRAGDVIFLTNFGKNAADIRVRAPGGWREVDTCSGEEEPVRRDGALRLLPDESRLLVRTAAGNKEPAGRPERNLLAAMSDSWEFRLLEGNVASLPMSIFLGESGSRPPAGMKRGLWSRPFAEITDFDLTPQRRYWLRREIEIDYNPNCLEFVVDGCDGCRVFMNGNEARADCGGNPVWDDDNIVCDILPFARRGRNEITVEYTPDKIRGFVSWILPLNDLPPFVLRGDFLAESPLDSDYSAPVLGALPGRVETGALQPRGYPGFAGRAEYVQELKLKKPRGRVFLEMGTQQDLFEVEINGVRAGVLGWAPYTVEIGKLLRDGRNRFLFRLHTALGGVISRYFAGVDREKPAVGMLETPRLYMQR